MEIGQNKWIPVTCTAALLDGALKIAVITPVDRAESYRVVDVRLIGGGTNFGAGGDRLLDLTDGTTVWTQIANADLETAPSATLTQGNAKVPFLTGTANTASTAGNPIYFAYSGGASDHTTGSITFHVCLNRLS